jgi:hypothetical protein
MRIYLDLDSRQILSTPNRPVRNLEFKRRDNDSLELQFVRGGTVVAVSSGITVQFGLKPIDQYSAGFYSTGAFVKSGSGEAAIFSAAFTLNTQPIAQAFDLEPKSISAMLEIEARDGETVTSSVTLPVTLHNDVIRGDEETPAAIPNGKATQAEAEAGTDNVKWMTPLRTKQAIDALATNGGGSGREVEFQKSATHIQWRYEGELTWTDLVLLDDLKGADGNDGAAGAAGAKGDKGDTGDVGPKGDTGDVGPKGDTGDVGPKGDTGDVGPKGDTGDVGPKGDTGDVGPKGDTGDVGPKGDTGDVGPKGDTGDVGPKGDTGGAGADALWNFTGAYNSGLPYAVGDIATYDGETWYRKNSNGDNVGDTPKEDVFWTKLAQKGSSEMALMRGSGVWNIPCNAQSATTYAGSGNGTPKPGAWRMETGSTPLSYSLYRANPEQLITFGRGGFNGGVDFSRPVWLIFSGQIGIYNTGTCRIQLGGCDAGSTSVGQMTPANDAFSGLGFEISEGQIKLETVNTLSGLATRNISGAIAAFTTPLSNVDLKAYSDGMGHVSVWVNNILVSSLPIGPTKATGNSVKQLRVSIENGASSESCFVDICQDQITVIVE